MMLIVRLFLINIVCESITVERSTAERALIGYYEVSELTQATAKSDFHSYKYTVTYRTKQGKTQDVITKVLTEIDGSLQQYNDANTLTRNQGQNIFNTIDSDEKTMFEIPDVWLNADLKGPYIIFHFCPSGSDVMSVLKVGTSTDDDPKKTATDEKGRGGVARAGFWMCRNRGRKPGDMNMDDTLFQDGATVDVHVKIVSVAQKDSNIEIFHPYLSSIGFDVNALLKEINKFEKAIEDECKNVATSKGTASTDLGTSITSAKAKFLLGGSGLTRGQLKNHILATLNDAEMVNKETFNNVRDHGQTVNFFKSCSSKLMKIYEVNCAKSEINGKVGTVIGCVFDKFFESEKWIDTDDVPNDELVQWDCVCQSFGINKFSEAGNGQKQLMEQAIAVASEMVIICEKQKTEINRLCKDYIKKKNDVKQEINLIFDTEQNNKYDEKNADEINKLEGHLRFWLRPLGSEGFSCGPLDQNNQWEPLDISFLKQQKITPTLTANFLYKEAAKEEKFSKMLTSWVTPKVSERVAEEDVGCTEEEVAAVQKQLA